MEETNASDLVGKYVIVQNADMADSVAGYVDYVQFESGEQYIYVNGSRYSVDDIYQVADPEYMEAVTVASAFKNTVDNLPDADELTLASENDVVNAASVYSAMSSYQQSYVDSDTLKKFNEVVSRMSELEEAYYNSQSQTSTDSTVTDNAAADEAAQTVEADA
jgi:flagellar basal-body rod modification protein FlgD